MSLAEQLSAITAKLPAFLPPETLAAAQGSAADFKTSFQPDNAIHVGDTLPTFRMPDALGHEVTSTELLTQGPLLITFYRGEWCPYCNLALAAMQKHVDEFEARGVRLVAISPELPNTSLNTTEKHGLRFTVLSDVDNQFARQLGIIFTQPEGLRNLLNSHDLKGRTGSDSLDVPVPATLLVDTKGVVRNLYLEPDYAHRIEPTTVLQWIDDLKA